MVFEWDKKKNASNIKKHGISFETAREVFSGDYYTVIVAENGIPALDLMRKYHPGVVVSDIMMPEMDGFELLKAVRDDEELSYIPVVLLTANNEEGQEGAKPKMLQQQLRTKPPRLHA